MQTGASSPNVHSVSPDTNPQTQAASRKSEPPEHFLDPITFEPMANPVFCSDGFTYDRKNAEQLAKSPFTRERLKILAPNVQLRSAILDLSPLPAPVSKPPSAPSAGPATAPSARPATAILAEPSSGEWGRRDGQGLLHGRGEREMEDGTAFFGRFEHGVFIEGTRFDDNAEYPGIDIGCFNAEGKLHGYGKRQAGRNDFSSHCFVNGDICGSVEIRSLDGTKYDGQFFNNFPNGPGHYTNKDGVEFKGDFLDGVFEGQNNVVSKLGDHYTGTFVNNFAHGKGKLIMEMCDIDQPEQFGTREYMGLFEQGKAHGQGVLKLQSDLTYTGNFAHGKAAGEGQLRFANGKSWSGTFVEGRPLGYGIYRDVKNKFLKDSVYEGVQRNWMSKLVRPAIRTPLVSVRDVTNFTYSLHPRGQNRHRQTRPLQPLLNGKGALIVQ